MVSGFLAFDFFLQSRIWDKNEFNLVGFQLMEVLWYLLSGLIKAT